MSLNNEVKYTGWDFVRLLGKVKMFKDKIKAGRLGQSFKEMNGKHL